MGIHNRDYFRDDTPRGGGTSYRGGSGGDAWAVKWIIGACVAMYFVQSATGQVVRGQLVGGATDLFALDLAGLKSFELWRVFTYGLCHAHLQHLLFNLIGVWVFGRMVESVYGSKETLAFFGAAVGLSGLAQIGVSVMSTGAGSGGVIGASGGVLGLVTLAAMNFPRMPMQLLFVPVPIELRWMAAGYVGIDLYQVLSSHNGNIANFAHLGGAAVGVLYFMSGIRLFPSGGHSGRASRASIGGVMSKLAPSKKPGSGNAPSVKLYEPPSEALQRDVDRLLDKINREGKESLSREENEILMKASESYRNRV